jgi:hypothetical protein
VSESERVRVNAMLAARVRMRVGVNVMPSVRIFGRQAG